ncbi:MAG: class E sortase [Actinobacteria bacterium]|nr:class E sortase [Actinomycetota bacterium]
MLRRSTTLALVAMLLAGCADASSATNGSPSATIPGSEDAGTNNDLSETHRVATTPTSPTTAAPTTATTAVSPTTPGSTIGSQSTTAATVLPVPEAPPEPRAKEPKVGLGSIEIPKLSINKTLFEGVSLTTLDRGPGHWPGTALPGEIGNVVVGGHRTSHDRPFRYLDQLVPGDEVIFTIAAGRFVYHVTRTEIVTPDSMWIINQTEAYTATLFACHPVGSTRERIVVFLELAI